MGRNYLIDSYLFCSTFESRWQSHETGSLHKPRLTSLIRTFDVLQPNTKTSCCKYSKYPFLTHVYLYPCSTCSTAEYQRSFSALSAEKFIADENYEETFNLKPQTIDKWINWNANEFLWFDPARSYAIWNCEDLTFESHLLNRHLVLLTLEITASIHLLDGCRKQWQQGPGVHWGICCWDCGRDRSRGLKTMGQSQDPLQSGPGWLGSGYFFGKSQYLGFLPAARIWDPSGEKSWLTHRNYTV